MSNRNNAVEVVLSTNSIIYVGSGGFDFSFESKFTFHENYHIMTGSYSPVSELVNAIKNDKIIELRDAKDTDFSILYLNPKHIVSVKKI